MKKIITAIAIMFLMQTTKAQFANTAWIGTFKIPDETQMLLEFTQDSLILGYTNNDEKIERMKYNISADTLTITKLDGISPCSYTNAATYKILLKDDKLYINALNDDCPERASAWPDEGLMKKE